MSLADDQDNLPEVDMAVADNGGDLLSSILEQKVIGLDASDWARHVRFKKPNRLQAKDWYIQCTMQGNEILTAALEISRSRRGGVPVLKGTGFTASQALAEIADAGSIKMVAEDFDLNEEVLKQLLNGLALILNRPFPE